MDPSDGFCVRQLHKQTKTLLNRMARVCSTAVFAAVAALLLLLQVATADDQQQAEKRGTMGFAKRRSSNFAFGPSAQRFAFAKRADAELASGGWPELGAVDDESSPVAKRFAFAGPSRYPFGPRLFVANSGSF